ncbi:hypothetical protein BDW22DRAFT_1427267 [Trametopsis cervina]|nr:hypothetical protein BDW22DRAFT_1427267 [Trametopsis cervina]
MARSRAGLVLGAAAVTTYVTWRTFSQPTIALDSVAPSSPALSKPGSKITGPRDSLSTDQSHAAPPEVVEKVEQAAESTESPQDDSESDEHGGGAFNPVTGEINWDCSCLGGMAYGPCGMQFREAFSCFVYSEQEPKGIDCVEKFKAMQDCFREHPEVYADEIMDDDDDVELPLPEGGHAGSLDPLPVDDASQSASLSSHTDDSKSAAL